MSSRRFMSLAFVFVMLATAPASAGMINIIGGEHSLLPGTETEIPIIAQGSGLTVQAVELYVEIQGRALGSPTITNLTLDAAGTMFQDNIFGGEDVSQWSPYVWSASALTKSGTISLDGDELLAIVRIDTRDVQPGRYTLMLKGVLADVFSPDGLDSNFPEHTTTVYNGTLNVVPEPNSILLLLIGAVACGAVVKLRRYR